VALLASESEEVFLKFKASTDYQVLVETGEIWKNGFKKDQG
jgi:hypothetical protein